MAVPRLRLSPPRPPANAVSAPAAGPGVSDEAELYHRTYTTLLRSSGETLLRVLEPSHRGMRSSLHPLAAAAEPDLGAFLYATRRLPQGIHAARVIVMGQEATAFARHGIGRLDDWQVTEAPARRRRWYVHEETFALLLASTSDLDDLIPTLVAYQLEWNKLHALLEGIELPERELEPAWCAAHLGAAEDDWERVHGRGRRAACTPSWARSVSASSTCGSACWAARRSATRA